MVVRFYDTVNLQGVVRIIFDTEIQYYLGYSTMVYCSTVPTSFTAALPAVTEKTWTITYNYTEQRLVLHCNGVQVLTVVISECDNSSWKYVWVMKPTQMRFSSGDDASDTYCFSSNPGKYNGVIDSGE